MSHKFHIALTADSYDAEGKPRYANLGLAALLSDSRFEVKSLAEHRPQIGADQLAGFNGVIVLTPAVTRQTVAAADNLLAVARFGVGYDAVDVPACTEADVVVFITAGAVDRPVAEAVVGWMIALTHHFRVKDRLLREGRWDERSGYMGSELRDRTLGVVGLGGIARKLIGLLSAWGMSQPLAYDPYADSQAAAALGVRLVKLDELLEASDFVSIHCPMTDATRGLIGRAELNRMKPEAYLINSARGGIVDEDALEEALAAGRIAGAALDCFVGEPITAPHRFAKYDNVLLAPHSIAWTNELFRDIGRAASQGLIDLAEGRQPRGTLNPEVFDRPGFQAKWRRLCHVKG
jgi:phosphoglycerate dehydrogenase-like enzyme